MNARRFFGVSSIALLCSGWVHSTHADSPWALTLGSVFYDEPTFTGSNFSESRLSLLFEAQYEDWFFVSTDTGIGIQYDDENANYFSVALLPGEERYEEDDLQLTGSGDINGGVALAFSYSRAFSLAEVSLALTKDFGDSDGISAEVGLWTGYPVGSSGYFGLGVTTSWVNDDYAQSFFGVDSVQQQGREIARANDPSLNVLPLYQASSGFIESTIDVSYTQYLGKTEQWFASVRVRHGRLMGDAKDSPITIENSENQAYLVLGYEF